MKPKYPIVMIRPITTMLQKIRGPWFAFAGVGFCCWAAIFG